ncbi:MAG: PAS domain-containing sensor histidine kinase [Paeniclostridium sordellii]|nr:PAS domain-containing sensor histidine kinase [Paeniclostridium sordellii]
MEDFKIYSRLLKTCPSPYMYGEVAKNEDEIVTDFIIKDLNDKTCKLLNIKFDDILGKSIKDILPNIVEKALKVGEDKQIYIEKLDGWYNISCNPISEKEYIIWITENNEINNLRAIQTLADAIPDYIFYKDKESKIIGCNKSYSQDLLELDRSEIIGKSDDELPIVNENYENYRIKDLEVIESNTTKTYYEQVTLKNNEVIHLETIKTPLLSSNGEVLGLIGIARNINERKKYEEYLEKARSEALANIAHELRTPLNLIFSSVQMLNHRYKIVNNKTNQKDSRYLNIIKQNGYRLLKLVDNLIDSTKLNYENVEFNPQNYDLVNFIESICESVSDFANQKGMNVIFDTDIEEKIVGFDLDKMERIILNLLSNALKFNRQGKDIEVTIKDLNENIQISVKDEGIGIPDCEIYKVFDRFKQIKNKKVNSKVGSGIGLSLVKSLVELHGGNIQVESKLGQGSEFIVTIPNTICSKKVDILDRISFKEKFVQKIEVEFSDIYA